MQVENVLDETRKPPAEDRFRFRRGLGAFCDGFARTSVPLHEVAARQRAVVVDFSAEDGEACAFAVVLDRRHGFQRFHVGIRDDEAVDVGVIFHVRGVRRLWQRQRAELQAVADAELGDGDAVFFRHRLERRVLQDGSVADGGIGLDEDAVLLRVFDDFLRRVADVAEHLVDDRLYVAVLDLNYSTRLIPDGIAS